MTWNELTGWLGRYSRDEYFEQFGRIEQILRSYGQSVDEKQLEMLAELASEGAIWMQIHLLSFCMKISGNARYTEQLLEVLEQAEDEEVGEYNRLSYYWQVSTAVFKDSRLNTVYVQEKLVHLYRRLFLAFSDALGVRTRCYIPVEERNQKLVFVFTSQVLNMEHAPTKTLLDRCYVLQRYHQKKVLIVNTAMQLTSKGEAPFFDLQEAEYLPWLKERDYLEFKGEKFDYFQCGSDMPDLQTMTDLVHMIRKRKPFYLLDIGGSDICADICGMFVPQLTMSTVFSEVAVSCGEYQMLGGELTETKKRKLEIFGVEPQKVRRTLFTFSFKEQSHKYTRGALGLPENTFLLLIVGWRLEEEIDGTFLELLQTVSSAANISVAFMGQYKGYERYLQEYPALREKSVYLGMQEDALAVAACCDLYVNPKRQGGGSSAAEALYQGLPVVTLPTGDVSVAAGKEFWAVDYQEMEEQIVRYSEDTKYYQRMSEIAKKRAALLLDSNAAFGSAICGFESELTKEGAD